MRRTIAIIAAVSALWVGLFSPTLGRAHPLTPAALLLRETRALHYSVSFRRSEQLLPVLALKLPDECSAGPRTQRAEGDQRLDEFELVCTRSLEGQTVRILGLTEVELSALVYVEFEDGESARELLAPYRTSFVVPKRSTAASVLGDYIELGAKHLLAGFDHILFVLGLLVLVRGLRPRLLALTAFTVGHSITLCLSALSIVALPQGPVELGIAASLIVLALEILDRRARPRDSNVGPWLMASAFGLLHGLGFASALAESGLPAHAVPLSLFGFNLGIELAQVAIVLALTPLLLLGARLSLSRVLALHTGAAYAIGALAAMWFIERALLLF